MASEVCGVIKSWSILQMNANGFYKGGGMEVHSTSTIKASNFLSMIYNISYIFLELTSYTASLRLV